MKNLFEGAPQWSQVLKASLYLKGGRQLLCAVVKIILMVSIKEHNYILHYMLKMHANG